MTEWMQSPGGNGAPHTKSPDCRGSGCVRVHILTDDALAAHTALVRASDRERLAAVEARLDAWGFGDEDSGIEHVGTCQDYGCKDCVVIACATDIRSAFAAPHAGVDVA